MKLGELLTPLQKYVEQSMNGYNDDIIVVITRAMLGKILASYEGAWDLEATLENVKPLVDFLSNRWMMINSSNEQYTIDSTKYTNIISLQLAQQLHTIIKNESGPYGLLMPSISHTENSISLTDLNEKGLALHQFIVSDDLTRFIEVFHTLETYDHTGKWIHGNYDEQKQEIPLTEAEIERTINHSQYTREYYEAIEREKNLKQEVSVGSLLMKLADSLEKGGIRGRGEDEKASVEATLAIKQFAEYLDLFTLEEKKYLFNLEVTLFGSKTTFGEVWFKRLIPDKKVDLQDVRFCVDSISHALRKLVESNPELYGIKPASSGDIQKLIAKEMAAEKINAQKKLNAELAQNTYRVAHIYVADKFVKNAVKYGFASLSNEDKVSLFNAIRHNLNLCVSTYEYLSNSDKDLMLTQIIRWPHATNVFSRMLMLDLIPSDSILSIIQHNQKMLKNLLTFMQPEIQNRAIQELAPSQIREGLTSIEKISEFVTKLSDPTTLALAIDKIGMSYIKDKINEDLKNSIPNLISMLTPLKPEQQNEILSQIGLDTLSKGVNIRVKPLVGSDFKAAFEDFKTLFYWNLHFYSPDAPSSQSIVNRAEYMLFLKVMAFAYLGGRDSSEEEYKHKWGSLFGGVPKEEKVNATKALIKAIDGDPEAIKDLANHQKALNQGDLGVIYKEWLRVKTTVFKESLHPAASNNLMINNS